MKRKNNLRILLLGIGISAAVLTAATFGAAETAKTAGKKEKKPAIPVLNIQGFYPGMTQMSARKAMRKKKIMSYETRFPDLFVYDPQPGTGVKLEFACSSKGMVLARVESRTVITPEEAEDVLPKLKQRLVERYGMPLIRESQPSLLDFCWGQCGQESRGAKLEATTPEQDGNRSFILVLQNEETLKACESFRNQKISGWLQRWMDDVLKYKTGLSLKQAAVFYQKRYRETMPVGEERASEGRRFGVTHYIVREHDFFEGLEYDAFGFPGEGPGDIMLKFTGNQAGADSSLNNRLYYAFFSTTKFGRGPVSGDARQKLEKFIKVHGTPSDVSSYQDGIMATWRRDTKKSILVIHDSGLITFEQSDPSLAEAYNEAALEMLEEYKKSRFDGPLF